MSLTKEQIDALYKMASPELKAKMDLENMQNNPNDFTNMFGDNNPFGMNFNSKDNPFSNMFNQKK